MKAARTTRTRSEATGRRPSAFSAWHRRELPAWAWACDLDWVEVRFGRGVVLVAELSEVEGRLTEARVRGIARSKPLQTGAVREAAKALAVPGLLVVHNKKLDHFGILDLGNDQVRLMGEIQFMEFLKAL